MTVQNPPLDQPEDTDETIHLSVGTKLAYGVGDVGAAIVQQVTTFFLTPFFLDVALLRPGYVSVILFIANVWDAVIDPFIGNWSDRTDTKWGKRRPWLLFGAIPFALAFFLQFTVPGLPMGALFLYFLIVTLFLRTAFSVVNVPYTAMTPELTDDYDERTSLNSFRFSFTILGGLAAAVFYRTVVDAFPDAPRLGNMVATGTLAIGILAATMTTFFFTRERVEIEEDDNETPLGIFKGVRVALQNRAFIMVLGIFLLSWMTVQFVQTVLFLYVRDWVGVPEQFTRILLVIQLTSFASLAVWSRISERIGKTNAYFIGIGLFIALLIGIFFIQPGQTVAIYAASFVAGICVAMALLLPWSMLPDVIEFDQLKTGQRRGGVFYGLFVFVQKIGLSLALATSTFVLGLAGYINPAQAGEAVQQPDSVLLTLRLFVSFIPAVLLALSIPLAMAYPITREKFEELRHDLLHRND